MGDQKRAEREQARKPKVRVYDIINAGPRHRFTVSGVLVHNCGYQGGVGAMRAMDRGGTIPDEELQSVVDQWRMANPKIVKLWRTYEAAARTAITDRRAVKVRGGVTFAFRSGNLLIRLPSGRCLCYWGAKLQTDPKDGREHIVYMGVNQETKQWGLAETYGGKLVENVTQATARDCLAKAMQRVTARGYRIVMHVHDEMIVDVPREDMNALARINEAMSEPILWAPGLPLKGDGYECDFYRKD
jgi:DNA polymerase